MADRDTTATPYKPSADGQRWLGNVTWPIGTDGGSFEFVDLTSAPTIGAFAENT